MQMKKSRLDTLAIALQNLRRRPYRTVTLIVLISALAFVLFGGSILSSSLLRGLDSMSKRLGADIMVVPEGYEQKVQGVLLRGEPSTFYLNGAIADKLTGLDGIEQISAQLFVASLSAECCSVPVQIIGFDPDTDFVIRPWFKTEAPNGIPDNQIVVGSDVSAETGEELKLFDRVYTVAAKLEKTGLGYDTSVFMNMESARRAIGDYVAGGGQFPPPVGNSVSSVMIGIKNGHGINEAAVSVKKALSGEGVTILATDDMFRSISVGLTSLVSFITVLAASIWLISVLVLGLMFSVTINERQREFGILRALGATRSKLRRVIFLESAIVSLSASLIGIFLAGLLLIPFSTYISMKLDMPYVQPSLLLVVLLMLVSLIIAFSTGPLAATVSAIKIGKSETYSIIRGEAT